ncbi:MAG: peroxidase family protein [Gaiellaceae bacterium]
MALTKLLTATAAALDRRFGWDRLPRPLGVVTLVGLRTRLRQQNLHDTGTVKSVRPHASGDRHLRTRTLDGSYNDLAVPTMGTIGARFGRNVPIDRTHPEPLPDLLEPNPRLVSRELLTRTEFQPATIVNVLAGAWLQFEVHDWFSHGKNVEEEPFELELAEDDDWPERPMRIQRTRPDASHTGDGSPPTYVTADSHWWDGSQIYGSDAAFATALRAKEGGKLRLDPDGQLPRDLESLVDLTGVAGNFWLGLALLHTLFTREHNAICERLAGEHPDWSDDELYDRARLINAALMAKIHTVEWTPAIIAHPTTRYAMRANWYGILGKRLGRRSSNEVLGGIPGSPTDHHGVPYSLTEEFVAVYRMHPLLPDDFTFRSLETDEVLEERTFRELGALHTRDRLDQLGLPNAFYSLGIAHPGAITLHNYPRFLQHFERPDGTVMDLAATDILRVRERGVPRYNEFRRLFHLKPAASFEELTGNPEWAEELRRVYGDVERVDLMVGLYAEPLPKGFGFSDTAFRVFILMASRRLKSDRFFTRDYNAETYTQAGLDWIDESSMIDVLKRHYPELEPALRGVENAFAPWTRVSS